MSAYICSTDHFVALACFAASRGPHTKFNVDPVYLQHADSIKHRLAIGGEYEPEELATYYAQVLYEANCRSVDHRYRETNERDKIVIADICMGDDVPALVILKAVNCLDYQSCERDDWKDSAAFEILQHIRNAAIRRLPGYDNAEGWDFHFPADRPVRVSLATMARRRRK